MLGFGGGSIIRDNVLVGARVGESDVIDERLKEAVGVCVSLAAGDHLVWFDRQTP